MGHSVIDLVFCDSYLPFCNCPLYLLYLFIVGFVALHRRVGFCLVVASGGYPPGAVRGLLTAVTALVVECRLENIRVSMVVPSGL